MRIAETFLLLLGAEREGVLRLSGDAKPLCHVLRRDAAEQTRHVSVKTKITVNISAGSHISAFYRR